MIDRMYSVQLDLPGSPEILSISVSLICVQKYTESYSVGYAAAIYSIDLRTCTIDL